MEAQRSVLRETLPVLVGVAVCTAGMIGVFALLGYYSQQVLVGGAVGCALAVLNFFVMALVADRAAKKAVAQDVKGGQAMVQTSYILRMGALLVVLVVCAKSGIGHPLALVLPLVFVRPVLTVWEFLKKKGVDEA